MSHRDCLSQEEKIRDHGSYNPATRFDGRHPTQPHGKELHEKTVRDDRWQHHPEGQSGRAGARIELDDNLIDNERGIPEWKFPEMWDAVDGSAREH
jgi:hypothetical protein